MENKFVIFLQRKKRANFRRQDLGQAWWWGNKKITQWGPTRIFFSKTMENKSALCCAKKKQGANFRGQDLWELGWWWACSLVWVLQSSLVCSRGAPLPWIHPRGRRGGAASSGTPAPAREECASARLHSLPGRGSITAEPQ